MSRSSSLVFFGSGPVALASLESLVNQFSIELVVTKPKSPKQKDEPVVLQYAKLHNLPIVLVSKSSELDEQLLGKQLKSQLGVVVDFGIIISQAVIQAFKLGIVNSHFSLLPALRGADPISFAILEGLSETGVSVMKIVAKMDEGPLLAQAKLSITSNVTTPSLTKQLISVSNKLLAEVLPKYITGSISTMPQDLTIPATYTRKLTKADGLINWDKPAIVLEREVRAFIGWPRSRTKLGDLEVIITKARVVNQTSLPGKILLQDRRILVGCQKDCLEILTLIVPGKSEMTGQAFLAGYRLSGL